MVKEYLIMMPMVKRLTILLALPLCFKSSHLSQAQESSSTSMVSSISPEGCGIREIDEFGDYDADYYVGPDAQIVGGLSTGCRWLWLVGIYIQNQYLCGGAVIDNRHILTAAHCFDQSDDPEHFTIQLGELIKGNAAVNYEIEDIKLHGDYKTVLHFNDIAIMRIKGALPHDVTPVCLPAMDTLQEGDKTTILGWGALSKDGPSSDVVQELHDLPVVDNEECSTRIKTLNPDNRDVRDNELCVGGVEEGGKDACQGDSGGPLLRQDKDGHWILEGVVSYGYGCAKPGIPGVYTRVASHLEWIEKNI